MELGFHTFSTGKQYVFLKDPATQTRTFLRNILILTPPGAPDTIAIVREWGAKGDVGVWEPPKGQMEWKEFADSGLRAGTRISEADLTRHQREGVLREMIEEAKILPSEIKDLTKMPLVYSQKWEDAGIPNVRFLYQYWTATTTRANLLEAQKRMRTLVDNEDWKHLLPADMTEKDGIEWFTPSRDRDSWKKIRGAFSKKMTDVYFDTLRKTP